MLVDTHMHLYYWNAAAGPLLDRASKAGVNAIVTLSVTPRPCQRTIHQPITIPRVYAGIGIHPLSVKGKPRPEIIEAIRTMARTNDPKVHFISELG